MSDLLDIWIAFPLLKCRPIPYIKLYYLHEGVSHTFEYSVYFGVYSRQ